MKLTAIALSAVMALSLSALSVGEIPKSISIKGENGGMVLDGSEWQSSMIKDKVFVMFYVDPDEKAVNEHYSKALKAEKEASGLSFQSIAIVNLAATWKPNFVIESILKDKQEEFPTTIYVKDKTSVLVKEWGVDDDASNILIFSRDGKLLFYKSGAMSEEDAQKSYQIIRDNS